MAVLITGAVTIRHGNEVTAAGIHGGFLQISKNQGRLLTDSAQLAEGGIEEARQTAAALRESVEPSADES